MLRGDVTRRADRLFRVASVGLGLVITFLAVALAGYVSASRWVDHTLEVRQKVDEWLAAVLAVETNARGYVLATSPALLESYDAARLRERVLSSTVASLVSDNPDQSANVGIADQHARMAMSRYAEMVRLAEVGRQGEAVALIASEESQGRADEFLEDIERVTADEARLLSTRRETAKTRGIVAGCLAALLAVTSWWLLTYSARLNRASAAALERAAGEGQWRLQSIAESATRLSEARTRAEVADVVVDQGMRAARADTCTLYLLDPSGQILDLIGERGVAAQLVERIRRLAQGDGNPVFDSFQRGKTLWAESEADYLAIYPELARAKADGPRAKAFWSVPLIVDGRPAGLLGMGFYEARTFPPEQRAFVETLAKQCGQALVRATMLERDASRQQRERVQREFRAAAGETLVSSLDYETTLATVARLAVPTIADWCAVELFDAATGRSQQAAVAHFDPEKVQLARTLGQRYPPDPHARNGAPEVMRTGKAELYAAIPADLLVKNARDAEHLQILRELRLESAIIVPLRGRMRILGAITFVQAESGRRCRSRPSTTISSFRPTPIGSSRSC